MFKNFLSELRENFVNYILYIENISNKIVKDNSSSVFDFTNIKSTKQSSVIDGLINIAISKSYIQDFGLTVDMLKTKANEFIKQVTFIRDTKTKAELIKDAINIDRSILPNDSYLENIFKEIRNLQVGKKNTCTEGIIINNVSDFSRYNKFIRAGEIVILITSRLINNNIATYAKIPISFIPYVSKMDDKEKKILPKIA